MDIIIFVLLQRIVIISYIFLILFAISAIIIFRKEISLCKSKSRKRFINLALIYILVSSIITIPFYLFFEDINYLKIHSDSKMKTEIMDLSAQGILPEFKYFHDYTIVGGSPTILEYFVRVYGDEGVYTFLVWLNTPFNYIQTTKDNVYIESVYILDNCEKILLYEKGSDS